MAEMCVNLDIKECEPLIDRLNRCRKHLEAALEHAQGAWTFDDVCLGVFSGNMILWEGPDWAMVLEVSTEPRRKTLHGFLCGGDDLEAIKAMQPRLLELARQHSCAAITLRGRRGWVRALKDIGWKETHTTVELAVDYTAGDYRNEWGKEKG